MKGLIILEGADGTGKTTLANHLVEKHGARYLHATYRYKDKMFLYHTAILKHALSLTKDHLVVLDRCWLSDTIYGAEYRGGSKWPLVGRFLDRVARKHAALTVMCLADDLVAYAERFARLRLEREEMYADTTNVAGRYNDVYYGYETCTQMGEPDDYVKQLIRQGGLRKRSDVFEYHIENQGQDVPFFANWLLHNLAAEREEQPAMALDPAFHNFLGHVSDAKFVMVGDQPSDSCFNHVRWPFFAYRNSSLYLTEALGRLNVDETQLCWVNVNDDYGYRTICNLVDTHGLIPVVMGEQARTSYTRLGLPKNYRFMPHPQFLRRFTKKSLPIDTWLKHALREEN